MAAMPKLTKSQRKLWLTNHGKWSEFEEIRSQLVDEGVETSEAWDRAFDEVHKATERGLEDPDDSMTDVEDPPAPAGKQNDPENQWALPDDGFIESHEIGMQRGSMVEAVQWVLDHLKIKDVKPSQAPTRMAWTMLATARKNNQNEVSFMAQMASKLIPSRAELERDRRNQEGCRVIIELVQRVQRASLEAQGKLKDKRAQKHRRRAGQRVAA